MNLEELRDLARLKLRDTATPYAWEDAELDDFINEAVKMACRCARLIYDRDISITTVDGTSIYNLPYTIQKLEFASYTQDSVTEDLSIVNRRDASQEYQLSQNPTGRPTMILHLPLEEAVQFVPTPDAAGSASIHAYRGPTIDELLINDSDEPPIPEDRHRDLIYWVLREAYYVHDADVQDKEKAASNEAQFFRAFGPLPGARIERQMQTLPPSGHIRFKRFGG